MRMGFTKILKELIYEQLDTSQFKRASELVASQWYWDHIRKEESLECKAYDDGENCKSEANELLMGDSTYHANKLRKIFTTWEGEGLNILITQGMFDALLSLSYNGGAGGIRRSDVIALLKTSQTVDKDKLYKAAESIKKYRVSMPGHKPRREKEYERFIDGL